MRYPQCAWLAGLIFWVSGSFAAILLFYWGITNLGEIVAFLKPVHVIAAGLALAGVGTVWQFRAAPVVEQKSAKMLYLLRVQKFDVAHAAASGGNKVEIGLRCYVENQTDEVMFMKIDEGSYSLDGRIHQKEKVVSEIWPIAPHAVQTMLMPHINGIEIKPKIEGRYKVMFSYGPRPDYLPHKLSQTGELRLDTNIKEGQQISGGDKFSITTAWTADPKHTTDEK
jgi:hypothetical protein